MFAIQSLTQATSNGLHTAYHEENLSLSAISCENVYTSAVNPFSFTWEMCGLVMSYLLRSPSSGIRFSMHFFFCLVECEKLPKNWKKWKENFRSKNIQRYPKYHHHNESMWKFYYIVCLHSKVSKHSSKYEWGWRPRKLQTIVNWAFLLVFIQLGSLYTKLVLENLARI